MAAADTHFWFMSVMSKNENGPWMNSYQGTITPKRGATRLDMFNQLRRQVAEIDPRSAEGVAVAFDIQPNRL